MRARSKRWDEVSVDLVGDRDAAWRASGNEVIGAPKAKMGMEAWGNTVSARWIPVPPMPRGGPLEVFLVAVADDQLVLDLSSRHDRGTHAVA